MVSLRGFDGGVFDDRLNIEDNLENNESNFMIY